MKITRSVCRALLILVAMAVAGSTTPVLAARPDIQAIQVNETVVAQVATQYCGFTVLRHDVGMLRLITHYDANGNPIREVDVYHLSQTFEANGKSLTGFSGGIDNIVYHADGSLTITTAGPDVWTRAPGGGHIWGTTGSSVTEVDPNGSEVTVRESGPNYYFNPEFCAAMAP